MASHFIAPDKINNYKDHPEFKTLLSGYLNCQKISENVFTCTTPGFLVFYENANQIDSIAKTVQTHRIGKQTKQEFLDTLSKDTKNKQIFVLLYSLAESEEKLDDIYKHSKDSIKWALETIRYAMVDTVI